MSIQDNQAQLEKQIEQRTHELKEALDKAKRGEERYAGVMYTMVHPFLIVNHNGLIEEVNPMAEKVFGYYGSQMIGQHIRLLMVRGKTSGRVAEYIQNPALVLDNTNTHTDTTESIRILRDSQNTVLRRKDNTEFPVKLSIYDTMVSGRHYVNILVQDITEMKLAEKRLLKAKEAAERANQAKTRFLSSMSHELRTPLNAVLGFAELMSLDETLTEEQQEYIRMIRESGQHQLMLVNEILDLSQIEAGKMQISLEQVDLSDILEKCRLLCEPLAEQHGVHLSVEESDLLVWADFTRLRQVLINLLSNAIKYGGRNNTVTLGATIAEDQNILINVIDTGEGLTAEQQELLFQPFERLGAQSTEVEGIGIGLALSRQLVELMKGEIGVRSTLGEGSTFWVKLPASQETTTIVSAEKQKAVLASTNRDKPQLNDHAQKAVSDISQDREITVLYIEDNPVNLTLVKKVIEKKTPYRFISAVEPVSGLELALSEKPDLILLDIFLPVMDGYEVLKRLKENEATRDIAVIALSANAMQVDVEKGMAAGFDDYLAKPIDVAQFLETTARVLAGSLTTD